MRTGKNTRGIQIQNSSVLLIPGEQKSDGRGFVITAYLIEQLRSVKSGMLQELMLHMIRIRFMLLLS